MWCRGGRYGRIGWDRGGCRSPIGSTHPGGVGRPGAGKAPGMTLRLGSPAQRPGSTQCGPYEAHSWEHSVICCAGSRHSHFPNATIPMGGLRRLDGLTRPIAGGGNGRWHCGTCSTRACAVMSSSGGPLPARLTRFGSIGVRACVRACVCGRIGWDRGGCRSPIGSTHPGGVGRPGAGNAPGMALRVGSPAQRPGSTQSGPYEAHSRRQCVICCAGTRHSHFHSATVPKGGLRQWTYETHSRWQCGICCAGTRHSICHSATGPCLGDGIAAHARHEHVP